MWVRDDTFDAVHFVKSGPIELSGDDVSVGQFGPHDSACLPGGLCGEFHIVEPVRKTCVLFPTGDPA